MKDFFKKIPKFLTYAAIIIACGLYIWAIIILLEEDNWIGISTITTLLLAIAAFWTIRQNYSSRKKEQRKRLLSEIVEWATEIHTVSLKIDLPRIDPSLELYIEEKAKGNREVIEGIKRNIVNKEHQRIEVETLVKYIVPGSRAKYIKSIAYENFIGHNIIRIIDDIIDKLVALVYIRSIKIGVSNPREGFDESAMIIVNRVDEELRGPVNNIDVLMKKYAREMSGAVNALFKDAAVLISK